MSEPIKYDIRVDGRVWLDDEPVDATQYPVLDHIIRALSYEYMERFTNCPRPNRDTLYGPGGSWITWSDKDVSCRVDLKKLTLEDADHCYDRFRSFVSVLNEGALDRTGAALGPLEVVLDFDYEYVLLFRDRIDKVAHFAADGPDDRPLSRHLAAWGMRLHAAVREAGVLLRGRRIYLTDGVLQDPLPGLQRSLMDTAGGHQDPETALAHVHEISNILSELPNLLEALR